jgi:hypothetical protein
VYQERPVVVVLAADEAPAMLLRGIPELDLEHAPVRPHDRLQLGGGRMQGDLEQIGLGVGRRHPRDRPHLRVAQLATPERRPQVRKLRQSPRHSHLLAGSPRADTAAVGEPVSARPAAPFGPRLPAIELSDKFEPASRGRVDVASELGDLPLQLLRRHCRRLSPVFIMPPKVIEHLFV